MQRIFVLIIGVLLLPILFTAHARASESRDTEIRAAVDTYVRQKTAGLGYEIRLKRISNLVSY